MTTSIIETIKFRTLLKFDLQESYCCYDNNSPNMSLSLNTDAYILFLSDQLSTGSGRLYSQILKSTTEQLENDHQFIQWLFPLQEASAYVSQSPIINLKQLQSAIQNDPTICQKMLASTIMMFKHWGLTIHNSCKESNPVVINLQNLKRLNGHDGLRFSRVLQSLVYHGFHDLATKTYHVVMNYANGHIAILRPSRNQDGMTLWEYYLNKSLKDT